MRCASILRRIDDHVDGLLPAPEAERVRDHLDACVDCRELAEAARLASLSMESWGATAAPSAHCFDAILRRVEALPPESLARRSVPPWSRWAGPVAVAAAAAIVAAVVTARRDDPSQRTLRPETMAARLGPLPGEEYVHVVDRRLDDGVRRRAVNARRDPVPPVVPVGFDLGLGRPR